MSAGVLIVGAGLAAQRAGQTLRAEGFDGRIRVVGAEWHLPYDRPPLSKEVLAGTRATTDLALRPAEWWDERRIDLLLGEEAAALDARRRRVLLAGGLEVPYDSLLIATGAQPRRLAADGGLANVYVLRTAEDADALRAALQPGVRLAIVGGGLIGQEVAATARGRGADVTVIEAGPAPLAGVVGPALGRVLARRHTRRGVRMLLGTGVAGLRRRSGRATAVELTDGRLVEADVVLVAVGVTPAAGWLAGSGLDPDGVITDRAGRTAVPDVFAAGDVARAVDPVTGLPQRGEHWEGAVERAAAAARAILGLPDRPSRVPVFWSDQYGVRLQVAGRPGLADSVSLDGDPLHDDFAARFARDRRLVGALLVGRPRALAGVRHELEARAPASGLAA